MLEWRARHATVLCLFLHFITGNLIIFAGILETPQLLCSQHCLITDLWKSFCAKEKGVDRNKLFTVTQNYLTGKFREKLLLKSSCCLRNKLGGGGNSIHLHCKVFLFKQRERKKYLKGGEKSCVFHSNTSFSTSSSRISIIQKNKYQGCQPGRWKKKPMERSIFLQIVQRWQNTKNSSTA